MQSCLLHLYFHIPVQAKWWNRHNYWEHLFQQRTNEKVPLTGFVAKFVISNSNYIVSVRVSWLHHLRLTEWKSHLWADRTNPQSGCKNTTNDRWSGKKTRLHTRTHTIYHRRPIYCLRGSESLALDTFKFPACWNNYQTEWKRLWLMEKISDSFVRERINYLWGNVSALVVLFNNMCSNFCWFIQLCFETFCFCTLYRTDREDGHAECLDINISTRVFARHSRLSALG